jgi:hypothetical protein
MPEFTLPLGMFQLHAPVTVTEAALPLRAALKDLVRVVHSVPADLPNRRPDEPEVVAWWADWTQVIDRVKTTSDQFQSRMKPIEFPEVLPPITRELIYASLVAEAFGLQFTITNYYRTGDQESSGWWKAVSSTWPAKHKTALASASPSTPRMNVSLKVLSCPPAQTPSSIACLPRYLTSRGVVGRRAHSLPIETRTAHPLQTEPSR